MSDKINVSLRNQFAKSVLVDKNANSREVATLKGTVKIVGGAMYVVLDGSDILTPVKTTVAASNDDRVEVRIYEHQATITGNLSDISIGENKAIDVVDKAMNNFVITNSNFIDGTINGSIFRDGSITGSQIAHSTITETHITDATFDKINGNAISAVNANIENIIANSETVNDLKAETAKIATLDSDYAKINFSNVDTAHIEEGWIQNLMVQGKMIVQEGTIFYLDAVQINADNITAGTMKADRLLLSGTNGLFYEINASVDGVTATELSQEEYQNQLHGDKIIAKTITADKISVSDLNAFQALIGGWHIQSDSLYSGGRDEYEKKDAVGAYLGSDGKIDIGSDNEYIRFNPLTGELRISLKSLTLGASDLVGVLDKLTGDIQKNSTAITQTGNYVEIGFESIDDAINGQEKDWNELKSYIRFVDGNIELGKESNQFKAILTNSELSFEDNGNKVSYINNQRMHITKAEVTDFLGINNWKFKQRSNGNLSLKWREGDF